MDHTIFLKKYAVQYLSKYDSTKKNLERVLKNKIRRINDIKKNEKLVLYKSIFKIIEELESKQIINDKRYTDTKILSFASQGKSKNFITSYLLHKGIEKSLINNTFKDFELYNPNWEFESAKIFVRKKIFGLNVEKNKEKNLAKMSRAGFNYGISKKMLGLD